MRSNDTMTWLSDSDEGLLAEVQKAVQYLYHDPSSLRVDLYTPHDPAHFSRVEKLIKELIPADRWDKLSNDERLLLSCCAWTHDIGMNRRAHPDGNVGDKELRKNHVEVGAAWVLEHLTGILGMGSAQVVAYIIRFHSRANKLDECAEELIFRGNAVRARLLAAYLRFADALEADQQRVQRSDPAKFALLTKLTFADKDETLFHWVKSYALGGVRIDHERSRVELEFRVPKECIRDSGFRFLRNYVHNEILDELESVESIFEAGQISSFHSVHDRVVSLSFTGHAAQDWKRLLDTVLHRLRVEYSPNSTEMTRASLLMLQDLEGTAENEFDDRQRDILNTLNRQLDKRPCHHEIALIAQRIRVDSAMGDDGLRAFRERFEKLLSKQSTGIASNFWARFKGKRHVQLLLYGCSESVAEVLSAYPRTLSSMSLLIAEGRPKSQHGAHNVARYVDGAAYAELLHEKLRVVNHDRTNEGHSGDLQLDMNLIPDIAVATAMVDGPGRSKVDAVVMGANGIYPDHGVAHSLGHLTVALIAHQLNVDVLVVASAAKIWYPGAQWKNKSMENRKDWFTKDVRLLDRLTDAHCRTKWNPREEGVEFQYITALITEHGSVAGNADNLSSTLESWRGAVLIELGMPNSNAAGA